jgi:hypothetical protein
MAASVARRAGAPALVWAAHHKDVDFSTSSSTPAQARALVVAAGPVRPVVRTRRHSRDRGIPPHRGIGEEHRWVALPRRVKPHQRVLTPNQPRPRRLPWNLQSYATPVRMLMTVGLAPANGTGLVSQERCRRHHGPGSSTGSRDRRAKRRLISRLAAPKQRGSSCLVPCRHAYHNDTHADFPDCDIAELLPALRRRAEQRDGTSAIQRVLRCGCRGFGAWVRGGLPSPERRTAPRAGCPRSSPLGTHPAT